MDIAVIGSGIAGLASTHILAPHHRVTLYEADRRFGGHSNTVVVNDPAAGELAIDTGFIVHNDRNYPLLNRLFADLDVAVQDAEMSFGVIDRDPSSPTAGLAYRATNLNTLFADRRNLVRPYVWRMLGDIARFYRAARRFLDDPGTMTIGEFLEAGGYRREFVELHLVPMGAAVWSMEPQSFLDFPAASLLRFLDNHGLLSVGNRPQWRTVVGGSRRYVDALLDRAREHGAQAHTDTPVAEIRRCLDGGVDIVIDGEGSRHFDRVVLAVHSDQALALIDNPTASESRILKAIRYQPNRVTLHTDTSILPPNPRAWAAWNYDRRSPDADSATLTYDLTTLQRLPGRHRYLVSLNSDAHIDPERMIEQFDYAHPVFDGRAVEAQRELARATEPDCIVLAGAWCGDGFHEDGIEAAARACRALGVTWGHSSAA